MEQKPDQRLEEQREREHIAQSLKKKDLTVVKNIHVKKEFEKHINMLEDDRVVWQFSFIAQQTNDAPAEWVWVWKQNFGAHVVHFEYQKGEVMLKLDSAYCHIKSAR